MSVRLQSLTMLQELHIEGNFVKNLGLLDGLSLTHFTYDEICELPRLPNSGTDSKSKLSFCLQSVA